MKIVIALRSWPHVHYYRSMFFALAQRGHTLHFLFDPRLSALDVRDAFDEFLKEVPQTTWEYMRVRSVLSAYIITALRELRSYRRYLVMPGQSDYYRRRWKKYLPFLFRIALLAPGIHALLKTNILGMFFERIENTLMPPASVYKHLASLRADLLIAAPMNMRFSREVEYVKAARLLHIPSATPIFSWDNLTTKGVMHAIPDRVLVWNHVQEREAIAYNAIPKERVRVTGALLFDKWFVQKAVTSREAFCHTHGLDPAKQFVLYLGSSRNIAHDETWLIENVREAFNKAGLSHISLVVRPHLANFKIYQRLNKAGIFVVPKEGGLPATANSLQLFRDTLAHAACVVGINTSAMIDAVCVDKPVVSILTDTYKETQEEAAHFKALQESGAIQVAFSVEGCVHEVKKILSGQDKCRNARQRFIQTWIRPRGLERAAGEWAADEVEALAQWGTI